MTHLLAPRLSRRALVGRLVHGACGVTLLDGLAAPVAAAERGGRDVRIVTLMMRGAMSHIDTFDPKPDRPEQGETRPIATATPGVQFGHHLPLLAARSEKLAVIRSLSTETGAHEQGQYLMRTSYPQLASIRHPALGAWLLHALGRRDGELPGYVLVGNGNDHPGSGFLDPGLAPVPVADPRSGLEHTRRPAYLSEKNFERRMRLADRIDREFRETHDGTQLEAYDQMIKEAKRLLGSVDLKAFDISSEPERVREAYGSGRFGLGCLLARRLVEAGVRCVEVEFDGWDMHRDIYDELPEKAGELDRGMAALLDDLADRGLQRQTLVILATEFGRSPRINDNAGRDHHPAVFSGVLAGAGIRGGVVHGGSDERGFAPDRDGVSVGEFNATIAAACGLDPAREFVAPNGRPFTIGNGGKPVAALLA